MPQFYTVRTAIEQIFTEIARNVQGAIEHRFDEIKSPN